MTGLIPEKELSRRSFLRRGGALVVGFSLGGSLLAGKASATVPTGAMTGYLPDSTPVSYTHLTLPTNREV